MTAGRPALPTLWPQVDRVVEGLRDGLGDALGDQLVGLYLSGSLAQGGFHPPLQRPRCPGRHRRSAGRADSRAAG